MGLRARRSSVNHGPSPAQSPFLLLGPQQASIHAAPPRSAPGMQGQGRTLWGPQSPAQVLREVSGKRGPKKRRPPCPRNGTIQSTGSLWGLRVLVRAVREGSGLGGRGQGQGRSGSRQARPHFGQTARGLGHGDTGPFWKPESNEDARNTGRAETDKLRPPPSGRRQPLQAPGRRPHRTEGTSAPVHPAPQRWAAYYYLPKGPTRDSHGCLRDSHSCPQAGRLVPTSVDK